jgi:hypothetical protein
MAGGYCLGLRPPLVELELLPPEIRESHPLLQSVAETNIASLPMLWINKDLRGPRHSVASGGRSAIVTSGAGYR